MVLLLRLRNPQVARRRGSFVRTQSAVPSGVLFARKHLERRACTRRVASRDAFVRAGRQLLLARTPQRFVSLPPGQPARPREPEGMAGRRVPPGTEIASDAVGRLNGHPAVPSRSIRPALCCLEQHPQARRRGRRPCGPRRTARQRGEWVGTQPTRGGCNLSCCGMWAGRLPARRQRGVGVVVEDGHACEDVQVGGEPLKRCCPQGSPQRRRARLQRVEVEVLARSSRSARRVAIGTHLAVERAPAAGEYLLPAHPGTKGM